MPITADQQIGFTALRQVQKRLIVCVPAHERASLYWLDHLTVRKIIGQ